MPSTSGTSHDVSQVVCDAIAGLRNPTADRVDDDTDYRGQKADKQNRHILLQRMYDVVRGSVQKSENRIIEPVVERWGKESGTDSTCDTAAPQQLCLFWRLAALHIQYDEAESRECDRNGKEEGYGGHGIGVMFYKPVF